MASVSIFNLTAGTALASADVLPFVDVSDHTQSAEGSTLKITVADFFGTVPSPVVVTASSANALAVGQNGATNPALLVDTSTASSATGLKVASAAAGGGVALVVLSSGTDENLTLNAKGAGTIGIGSVSTGRVTITPATTITGALTQTGLATFNGGATVASGQTLTVTGATITGLTAASVASGTFPGVYTITGALTLSSTLTAASTSAHTLGPVTLTNGAVAGVTTLVTSSTINSQTISSTAHFTGTLSVATGLTVTAGGITVTAGNVTYAAKLLFGTDGSHDSAPIQVYRSGGAWFAGGDAATVGHATLDIGTLSSTTVVDLDATAFSSGTGVGMYLNRTGGSVTTGGAFGCNGATAQAKQASGGTLAGVIAALVANGILSS